MRGFESAGRVAMNNATYAIPKCMQLVEASR